MVDYLPRSAWGARPPKSGPGLLTPSRVDGTVIHWPGSGETDSFDSSAEVASALRGWQAYHMDSKGWSDIAYQVAVDQAGRAWILRGLRTQSGANGNNELNEAYGAILLVLVTGEQPSAAMKATVREVITDFREIFPGGIAIRPHSAVRPEGTDCPGDKACECIANGDFTPGAEPTTPNPEDDMSAADVTAINAYQKVCCIQIQKHGDQVLASTITKLTNYIDARFNKLASDDELDEARVDSTLAELKSMVTDLQNSEPEAPAPKA